MLKQDGTVWGVGAISGFWPGAVQPTRLFPAISDAVMINSAGADYALRANGELWASGRNETGQVGDGTTTYRGRLDPFKVLDQVAQFSANHMSALAVKRDGTVWAWGNNDQGQLGDGTLTQRLSPVRIEGLSNIVMVAANGNTSAALGTDGTVWAWGRKDYLANGDPNGYLADDPRYVIRTPQRMPGLRNIVSIGASFALDGAGRLWGFGPVWTGLLGHGSTSNPGNLPVQVAIPTKVKSYSATNKHALALAEDGSVWAWGENFGGQLALPPSGVNPTPARLALPGPAQEATAGWTHSAILLASGRVLTFGNNSSNQLGRGDFVPDHRPDYVVSESGGGTFSAASSAPADLPDAPTVGISLNGSARGSVPLTLALQATGAASPGHSIVRHDWIAGTGVLAQGASTSLTLTKPGAVPIYLVVTDDYGLKAASLLQAVPLPADVATGTRAQVVLPHDGRAVNALDDRGRVVSWGAQWLLGAYVVGNGPAGSSLLPVDNGLRGIVKLASSGVAVALTWDGLVLTWGFNSDGALGDGSTVELSWDPVLVPLSRPAIDIAGSDRSGYAVLDDGSVWGWGSNDFGQLGLQDTAPRNLPVQIPSLANIAKIAATRGNGFAIDRDGALWAWGDNRTFKLGQGDAAPRFGVVRVPGLPPIAKVAAGGDSVLAVARDGRVFGWGSRSLSLGDPTINLPTRPGPIPALAEFTEIVAGNSASLGVKADGTVWTWGANGGRAIPGSSEATEPRPKQVPGVFQPRSMAMSSNGGAIVMQDGSMVTWGLNNFGQIGDGTLARRFVPTYVLDSTGSGLLDLAPGAPKLPQAEFMPLFLSASSVSESRLSTQLTDTRAGSGISGSVYYSALLPSNSPLLAPTPSAMSNALAVGSGMVPVTLIRGGWKQTGPNAAAQPVATGTISTGDEFAAYDGVGADPLKDSNAVICIGIGLPSLSAKGQVLMRMIATGDQVNSVTQCPTVQTEATTRLYTAQVSGSSERLTVVAKVQTQPEDYGQQRNLYSWAVAPDGRQFMQIGPNAWVPMSEPMTAAMTVTVPADGSPVTLPVVQDLDLSAIAGTLAYVGLGSSWEEVKAFNKAGHYYTVPAANLLSR